MQTAAVKGAKYLGKVSVSAPSAFKGSLIQTLGDRPVLVFDVREGARSIGKTQYRIAADEISSSVANKLRLRTKLEFEQAGILDKNGRLTKFGVDNSTKIKLKDPIRNEKVIEILTRDGSRIEDWFKYDTDTVKLGNNQRRRIHFYKNDMNEKIDYRTLDFKVKDLVEQ